MPLLFCVKRPCFLWRAFFFLPPSSGGSLPSLSVSFLFLYTSCWDTPWFWFFSDLIPYPCSVWYEEAGGVHICRSGSQLWCFDGSGAFSSEGSGCQLWCFDGSGAFSSEGFAQRMRYVTCFQATSFFSHEVCNLQYSVQHKSFYSCCFMHFLWTHYINTLYININIVFFRTEIKKLMVAKQIHTPLKTPLELSSNVNSSR